ncbi:hypothetical protein TOPH_05293 [Tolypocladium ophioglossoides CBS 100239]|uniref:NADH dehydrogenase (Ubiquinone)-like protein n=1 Tax=Tolypocladium ophioglossoides (strain CBS 100239) TaxID=1163406 RepID=A0A0L0N7R6_TOLOC|nr:hypothetical protein TOPH_05293 [Tolypocladium ophioglossoides CBS 100239]
MRFEDWDILLFPRGCKTPVKEFKVACHVVHDAEFSHSHGSIGLPTVCCFVPSLAPGAPFQVSIHSWSDAIVSQFARSYSKFPDTVKFEAKLFVDGRLVASTALDRKTTWPHVIAHTFDMSKNGNIESLKFPAFRQELLQQSYWSPADDLGRIKVVLSEGFPRDSLTMPIERVRNIVTFSFQHAPLDVLESSSIAWPNASMWHRAPFVSSMPVPSYPSDDADSHAHSPRRRTGVLQSSSSGYSQGALPNPSTNAGTRRATHPVCSTLAYANTASSGPFGEANNYFEWLSGIGMGVADVNRGEGQVKVHRRLARRTSTDISMPDYVEIAEQPLYMPGLRQDDDGHSSSLKVPTNTPTTSGYGSCEQDGVTFSSLAHSASIPSDLANSLTNSLLNQPMPVHMQQPNFHAPMGEIKSRKENRFQQLAGPSPSAIPTALTSCQDHQEMRRVSQQMYMPSGASLPVCTVSSQANSPEAVQRVSSMGGELSAGVNNLSTCDTPLSAASGNSVEKGTKRVRNFTPASARAIEEEDEPRRGSPRVRLTPFTERAVEEIK